jgi:uncharacterized spore protein YtfJ
MENQFELMLEKLMDNIKSLAKTESIIGEPFQLGEFTCVPVIKYGLGMGSGMGEGDMDKQGKGNGGGAGGGIGIAPAGFLVSKGDNISLLTFEKQGALHGFVDKLPDMMQTFMSSKNKKEEVHS